MIHQNRRNHYQYLIVGAGFAGLATAYYMAKQGLGKICIIEKDPRPGLAASGRNAGMICQLVRDPVLSEIMMDSAKLIHRDWLSSFESVSYNPSGSVHLGSLEDMNHFSETLKIASGKDILTERIDRTAAIKRWSFLKDTPFDVALWCPSDGIVDTLSLLHQLAKACRQMGVHFQMPCDAMPSALMGGGYEIMTRDGKLLSGDVLINAAGAWAAEVSTSVGGSPLNITPMRRHIYVTSEHGLPTQHKPIVWDVTDEIYIRPEQNGWMTSPCDEEVFAPGPTSVSPPIENQLRLKLRRFVPVLKDAPISRCWSGLRTFSDDRRFIIGWDKNKKGLFWVGGLGGYGMTASARVGQIAASLITTEDTNASMKAVDPNRFTSSSNFSVSKTSTS